MKKILKGLQWLENTVVVIAFAVMVIAMFAQVFNRNITKIPVSGFEEIAKYCMIYMILLGTELGLRDGTQISVTAAVDALHGTARKAVQVISKVIVIGFSGFLFKESFDMVVKQITTGQTSASLQIPMSIPYAAMPIAFGLITVVQLVMLISLFLPEKKDEMVEGGSGK